MAKLHLLRALVNQRLTAAADEIFGVFERTITQYEEELHRQRDMLDSKLLRADPPQLSVCEEEVPPEQQERSPSLDQEDPQPLQIKEELEELWSSQEEEQLQGLEEAEIIKFTSTPHVPVKSEHDEERPQPSWFHQTQNEPLASTSTEQMKAEPDGEDCGLSEPVINLDPAGDLEPTRDVQLLSSDYSDDGWEPQSALNTLRSEKMHRVIEREQLQIYMRSHPPDKPISCSVRGESVRLKAPLQLPVRTHAGPFSGSSGLRLIPESAEGQSLFSSNTFNTTMMEPPPHQLKPANHTAAAMRPANHIPGGLCCKVCGRIFPSKMPFMVHIRVHSNGCGLCGKHFDPTENLKLHLKDHRTCQICGKVFNRMFHFVLHMRTHTGEKPFSCSVCGKRFRQNIHLKLHMKTHLREQMQFQTT